MSHSLQIRLWKRSARRRHIVTSIHAYHKTIFYWLPRIIVFTVSAPSRRHRPLDINDGDVRSAGNPLLATAFAAQTSICRRAVMEVALSLSTTSPRSTRERRSSPCRKMVPSRIRKNYSWKGRPGAGSPRGRAVFITDGVSNSETHIGEVFNDDYVITLDEIGNLDHIRTGRKKSAG